MFVAILPRVPLLAGTSDGGPTRIGLCRGCEKTTLFPRAGTHVLSRSPGSRDERALRAPLKATPDSKPRPSPAILASELPLLLPLALSLCPFSFGISLSQLPLALASFPLRICIFLFLPSPFLSVHFLSLAKFYLISVSLPTLLRLRTLFFFF